MSHSPYFLLLAVFLLCAPLPAQTRLQLNLGKPVAPIQPTMYGIFFEDINLAADGGLYAELVKNRGFEFDEPLMGWTQPHTEQFGLNTTSGMARVIKGKLSEANQNFCRVTVQADTGFVLVNSGFRGMGLHAGAEYRLTLRAAGTGEIKTITLALLDEAGQVVGDNRVELAAGDWATYTTRLTADREVQKGSLRLTFSGTGEVDLDQISLMPVDTWMGRENGLRKDIVQLLADLKPGFLRFPGGCIVEGRTLAKRYQWKKTVGPVAERTTLINRWNTEFAHRPTPDYFQSFGIGFFEYFQLAEDLGAEALPILSCGLACQFNTGEMVPLDELDPYVQDAVDLIEFANGSTDTPWGKVRADMGHPEPFNLTYLGIGNEQWGPEYIERYDAFAEVLAAEHPEIVLVSGSGPFPDGEFFDFAMGELKARDAAIIDEHYYAAPEWFLDHATRYDAYDRKGPKVFAGEYAAQSVATTSPDNKNNWECALAEAAFMTGLERNAEVVVMTSYAPLLAHVDGWQWSPDLIWFDNLKSYGTPNYYVQQLYSTHRGTDVLSLTDQAGQPLVGQDSLYASAVQDATNGQVYVKLVNTSAKLQEISLDLKGGSVETSASQAVLSADGLDEVNSLESPLRISPQESDVVFTDGKPGIALLPHTFTVLKLTRR